MPNFKKFLNKKITFLFVFVFILIVGGLFFWWQNREIKGSVDDYVIRETAEGKIVENKKAGFSIKAPEGWEVEKMDIGEGLIVFYSPNIEGELENGKIVPPIRKGCVIHVNMMYEKMSLNQLKLEAKYNLALLDVKFEEFEEVMINNYQALKITADTQKIGDIVGIDIPYKNRAYSFSLLFSRDDENNCIKEFDEFLERVLIQ